MALQLCPAPAPETHSFITQGARILNIQLESNCLGSNPSLTISSLCDCGQITSPL